MDILIRPVRQTLLDRLEAGLGWLAAEANRLDREAAFPPEIVQALATYMRQPAIDAVLEQAAVTLFEQDPLP